LREEREGGRFTHQQVWLSAKKGRKGREGLTSFEMGGITLKRKKNENDAFVGLAWNDPVATSTGEGGDQGGHLFLGSKLLFGGKVGGGGPAANPASLRIEREILS